MIMATLAAGHRQTDSTSRLLGDITKQGHLIWVTTDITMRMVTLAAQHEHTTQVP